LVSQGEWLSCLAQGEGLDIKAHDLQQHHQQQQQRMVLWSSTGM
jgi:hypothetical protein